MPRPTYRFSIEFDKNKEIKTDKGENKKALSFATIEGKTTTRIFLDSAFSEENMRNGFWLMDWSSAFRLSDSRAKSILVDENHQGFDGSGEYFPDTNLQGLWMYLNEAGYKDVMGEIVSTNPEFAEVAKRATGVSVVLEAPDFAEWYLIEIPMSNGKNKEIILAQQARIQSIAVLTGNVEAGSGGSRIGGKEFTTQGSRAAPIKGESSQFNNFKKIKMTKEEIQSLISEGLTAGFKKLEEKLESDKKVTFSVEKDGLEAGKTVEIDGQKFTLAPVKENGSTDEEDKEFQAAMKRIQSNKELAEKAGVIFTKKVGEEDEKDKSITFDTTINK